MSQNQRKRIQIQFADIFYTCTHTHMLAGLGKIVKLLQIIKRLTC